MELIYIVIFSFFALILLFGTSYLLALILNKASDSSEWVMAREPVMVKEEGNHTEKEDRP